MPETEDKIEIKEVTLKSYSKYILFMIRNHKKSKKLKSEKPYEEDFAFYKLMTNESAVLHCNVRKLYTDEHTGDNAKVLISYQEVQDETGDELFKRVTKMEIKCDLLSSTEVYKREDVSKEGSYDTQPWKKLSKKIAKLLNQEENYDEEDDSKMVFKIKGLEKKSGGVE